MAQGPNTITQIAEALGLSAPSVHAHVSDMLRSEPLREAVAREKTHPAERYYEPNFPVIKEHGTAELCELCDDLSVKMADIFKKQRRKLEKAFRATSLADRGWDLSEVAQCVFARVQRGPRHRLEQEGMLVSAKSHRNGVDWLFWAEESGANDQK